MAAIVNVGSISVGAASHAAGVFNGQNQQTDWDSHSPITSALGTLTGNRSAVLSLYAALWTATVIGQPVFDEDIKSNGCPMWIRP